MQPVREMRGFLRGVDATVERERPFRYVFLMHARVPLPTPDYLFLDRFYRLGVGIFPRMR